MNTNTTLVVIVALLVGGIGGYVLNDQTSHKWGPGMMSQVDDHDGAGMGMHHMPNGGTMGEMDHMMAMMISSEREFIEGMIPHHQEAVDTAKEVIARGGTTPEIKQLVENIVTAQEREIAAMKEWYAAWYGETYTIDADYRPMMRDLSQLSGEALDRTFLEDMVMHHMGAIMMAHHVAPYITHQEIEKLTAEIIQTQSEEIGTIQRLLGEL